MRGHPQRSSGRDGPPPVPRPTHGYAGKAAPTMPQLLSGTGRSWPSPLEHPAEPAP